LDYKTKHVGAELVFCQAVTQQFAVEKGVKIFSQLHYLPYFAPAAFYLFLKVKSELASCLLTHGAFKKRL
jgi:hypothetical protein